MDHAWIAPKINKLSYRFEPLGGYDDQLAKCEEFLSRKSIYNVQHLDDINQRSLYFIFSLSKPAHTPSLDDGYTVAECLHVSQNM